MSLLFLFLSFFIGLSFRYNILFLSLLTPIFLFFIFRKKNKWLFIACIALIILGVGLSFIHLSFQRETYKGIVIEVKDNYFILSSYGERLYVSKYNHPYEVGDIVSIEGQKYDLYFNYIESGFDFASYLKRKGIQNGLYINSISIIFSSPLKIHAFQKSFLSFFNPETSSLIGSLLFSYGKDNDSLLMEYASSLHLMRYVSSSGIYYYFFLKIIDYLFSYKFKEKTVSLIKIFVLTPLLFITSFKFALLKIILILVLNWINKHVLKEKISYLSVISISGFIFLIINYHLAYQDSFILGYLIPISMYFFNPIISSLKRWKKKVSTIIFISLLMLPFTLSYYHEIAFLSPIYQILLFPFFLVFMVLGALCFIKAPLYSFTNTVVGTFQNVLGVLDKINPKVYAPTFNPVFLLIFYSLLFVIIYYQSIRFRPMIKYTLSLAIVLGGIYFVPLTNLVSEKVSFINVGQGDCCLIRSRSKTIMVDTGGNIKSDIAFNNLIPYLKKERIYNIDLLITTHDDYDHAGAKDSLMKHFYVKNYIDDYTKFPIIIGNINLVNYNNHISEYSEENDQSLVIGFHLLNKDFLIMGDAPIKIEKQIMNEYESIPCDILKVGHHGSKTSTSEEWVKYLSPKEAIISCGYNNSYGHPHSQVIHILQEQNVRIRRTDLSGTITYFNYIFM